MTRTDLLAARDAAAVALADYCVEYAANHEMSVSNYKPLREHYRLARDRLAAWDRERPPPAVVPWNPSQPSATTNTTGKWTGELP